MATLGDIIRVKAFGNTLGQAFLNVFFYEIDTADNPTVTLNSLGTAWGNAFASNILPAINDQTIYNRIVVDNLTGDLDFADVAVNLPGAIPSDPMPGSLAIGVDLIRTTKVTRQGYKRFPGLVDSQVSGNVLSLSQTNKDNIEFFCGGSLFLDEYEGVGTFVKLNHKIVGRTLDANNVYQLDLTKLNQVGGAQVRTNVSTQNTRKP